MKNEVRAKRKYTIKAWNLLKMLDAEAPPTPPPKVIHHPRAFDKPLSCLAGKHRWVVKQWRWSPWYYATVPILYCPRCGAFVFKDSYEGTETKRELRERFVPPREKPKTDKELVEEAFRVMNFDPKR